MYHLHIIFTQKPHGLQFLFAVLAFKTDIDKYRYLFLLNRSELPK